MKRSLSIESCSNLIKLPLDERHLDPVYRSLAGMVARSCGTRALPLHYSPCQYTLHQQPYKVIPVMFLRDRINSICESFPSRIKQLGHAYDVIEVCRVRIVFWRLSSPWLRTNNTASSSSFSYLLLPLLLFYFLSKAFDIDLLAWLFCPMQTSRLLKSSIILLQLFCNFSVFLPRVTIFIFGLAGKNEVIGEYCPREGEKEKEKKMLFEWSEKEKHNQWIKRNRKMGTNRKRKS